ncbi:hypothetical protein [Bradyrhizobium diazoefficiens]|uniref:hypothetical protein n=1 Tax=Bradyrhizobium diazoefficiens TaxID=1355477 RepID=UPI001B63E022|nr:hypothetical protein [Bradyrhizobium japonicum]
MAIGKTNGLPNRKTIARLLRQRPDGLALLDQLKARWLASRPQFKERAPRRKGLTAEQLAHIAQHVAAGGLIANVAGTFGLPLSASGVYRLLAKTEQGRQIAGAAKEVIKGRRQERIARARLRRLGGRAAKDRFDALLDLVRSGMPYTRSRRLPGIMSGASVQRYIRGYPDRARRFREAQEEGRPKRVCPLSLKYSDAHFDASLELIATTPGNVNDVDPPGLPSYFVIAKRAKRDQALAVKLDAAIARRIASKVKNGWGGRGFRYAEECFPAYVAKLEEAQPRPETLTAVRKLSWPGLPGFYTVWRRKEFREQIRPILQRWGLLGESRGRRNKSQIGGRQLGEHLAQLLLRDEAFREAERCVPRRYERQDRDDIKQDIVVAVLCGELAVDEIAAYAQWFASEHFRGGVFSSGKFHSLDAAVYDDGDVAYVDRLSSDDYSHIG